MKSQTLRYYMHDGISAFRFELAGDLDDDGARELSQAWLTASSVIGRRTLIVDMTFLSGAGEGGRSLLARWYAEGAKLIAKSSVSRELAEAIVGKPLPEFAPAGKARAYRTWLPFYTSFLIAALLAPAQVNGAKLKAETVEAWDEYVQSVSTASEARVRPNGRFLWTYEDSKRLAQVLSGEIVVAPAPGPNPRRVPGGLIHHWIGAAFLPNAKLSEILEVTQDYDRYKEFYQPSVVESKTNAREKSDDRFSMLLMNQAFFSKTALDADYQATKVNLQNQRFYSVSRTTRMQEIEDYGRPGARRIPEGEGGGLIWKLFSIVRLEQRDGGVYFEMEAVALSREIPGALHVVVDPIVRRVSRNSMLTSIKQTEDAVRRNSSHFAPAGSPASVEHRSSVSTGIQNHASAFTRVQ